MIPTDGPPDSPGNDLNVTFSALAECDQLVQAFRDFLLAESSKRNPKQPNQIVAEFSRRVTFLTQHLGLELNDEKTLTLLPGLSDAVMAQLALDSIHSEAGRRRFLQHLESLPFPHYEADPEHGDRIVRIEEDGSRISGRFVNRQFVAVESK